MAAMVEELHDKATEITALKELIDSLKAEKEQLAQESDAAIDALYRKIESLEREASGSVRTNECLAEKIAQVARLTKQLELEKANVQKHEEEIFMLKKSLDIEKSNKRDEVSDLKEQIEILIKATATKDAKYLSLKERMSRLKSGSSTVLGSMQRTASSLSLRPSDSSNDRVNIVGETSDDDRDPPSSSSHRSDDDKMSRDKMLKRLRDCKWPQFKAFFSHDDFVAAIESQIKSIRKQGIDDDLIADNLHNNLIGSEVGSPYATHSQSRDTSTLEGVVESLVACDRVSGLLGKYGRFKAKLPGSKEKIPQFVQRLANHYDSNGLGEPGDDKGRLRAIIDQLCHGAQLPASIKKSLRHCQTLDDVILVTMEEMKELNITETPNPPHPTPEPPTKGTDSPSASSSGLFVSRSSRSSSRCSSSNSAARISKGKTTASGSKCRSSSKRRAEIPSPGSSPASINRSPKWTAL